MRPDGKRILAENPLYNLMPYVLTKRYDAMNMVTLDIPEAPLRAYMNAKRAEKQPMSHLALLLTAYLRAVEKYPALNRFISGNHKIYQRNNISVAMVVLRPGGGSTMSKIILNEGDTVFDVQRKITDYVDTNRQGGGEQSGQAETNGLDKLVNFLLHTGPLLNILMWALRFADRHGLLPRASVATTSTTMSTSSVRPASPSLWAICARCPSGCGTAMSIWCGASPWAWSWTSASRAGTT